MKKILWVLGISLIAFTAQAQMDMEPQDLDAVPTFKIPEIPTVRTAQTPAAQNTQAPADATSSSTSEATQRPTPQLNGLFPELSSRNAAKEQQSVAGPNAGQIRLVVTQMNIVQPPFNNVGFCVGTLVAENNLSEQIKSLRMNLGYGSVQFPVAFNNIPPLGGTQQQDIVLAGDSCNFALKVPTITLKACTIPGLSLEQCQQKIRFQAFQE